MARPVTLALRGQAAGGWEWWRGDITGNCFSLQPSLQALASEARPLPPLDTPVLRAYLVSVLAPQIDQSQD